MKRFKLQCGAVITIDDCDAYLLRSYVWRSHAGSDGRRYIVRGAHGSRPLSHTICDITGKDHVAYANGDTMDLRRSNLVVVRARQKVAA